jgi:DNA-binding transcriptional LysR family regulator
MDPTLLPALHDVLAVARAGSVGVASRQLHKTSSAVSQQIRRVEEHFRVELFERAGRGIRLSAGGEAALGAINRLFDEAESVFGLLSELSGKTVTTLRVAASDYLGKALLLPVIRELFESAAPLKFQITTTHSPDAARAVERGEADFAVITSRETPGTLVARPVTVQRFVWVGPRIRGLRAPLSQRLAREPLLRLTAGSEGRRLFDDYLERNRIRPASTIDVPSVSLMLSYASGGLGIGLCPTLALENEPRARLVAEPAAVEALPVQLIYRSNFRLTAAVEGFVEKLLARGSRGPGHNRAISRGDMPRK